MKYLTLVVGIFLLLFLCGFVIAAGTSTGSDRPLERNATRATEARQHVPERQSDEERMNPCENFTVRTERIRCRLMQRNVTFNAPEESCRGVADSPGCLAMYARVKACYDRTGQEKDQCFKRIAGFVKSHVREERNATSVRAYAVFLLYDLQEKVEAAHDAGRVNDDSAAEIISLIVEIKQDIMAGKMKADIQPKIQHLKTLIREARA